MRYCKRESVTSPPEKKPDPDAGPVCLKRPGAVVNRQAPGRGRRETVRNVLPARGQVHGLASLPGVAGSGRYPNAVGRYAIYQLIAPRRPGRPLPRIAGCRLASIWTLLNLPAAPLPGVAPATVASGNMARFLLRPHEPVVRFASKVLQRLLKARYQSSLYFIIASRYPRRGFRAPC